ncbi:urease accessory protein UreD [Acidisoma cellulosilytica]|uniref:Urease accessory protein UreD n=1 Tax=Acidisoma cellulosilyticum TaxID=2802395 RepID=A0A964E485_9PROT|nr:urease accessory protein UreD [Acidisoma cellulosilyticum]MCB8881206.1 urease accessory protein UreD [Acidisoma cellulosilyticum]
MNALADLSPPPLDLSFQKRGRQTVLAHRHVTYPFFVTAPLRGQGPTARIILQSVSGGLFGDERVAQRIAVGPDASAVIVMPSATIVHDRRGKASPNFAVTLHVEDRACLHYLPRPVILLPGSGLVQSIDLTIGQDSTVLIQDGFLMHDPQGFAAAQRHLDSRVSIRDAAGRIVALDRTKITDTDIAAGTYRAFGSLWLLRAMHDGFYETVKDVLSRLSGNSTSCYWGMTRLRAESGIMIRIAAHDGGDLDIAMTEIRNALLTAIAV